MTDTEARERTVLAILDKWPWALGGVLIGGYAVSAYGPPRYSVDVDIVVATSAAEATRLWLRQEGFTLSHHAVPNPQNYGGQVERYTLNEATLDILSGAVRDRDAQVDVPQDWIAERPRKVVLETLSGRTSHPIQIARPEALWALKLQSGRDLDIADLFAISAEPVDIREVTELFSRLASHSLSEKLRLVLAKLRDPKLFRDSLSRRGLGSPREARNLRAWERFTSRIEAAVRPVAGR